MFRGRNVRIYVRNKARYNPESKERGFLFVDIADFAGTTIGDIKENVRRQTKNSIRIDALYLNNEPLANDRSVAHYNLEDGSILETTSNPFWVSCLYIKAAEVKQAQEGHPDDEEIQKWTQKSLPKKFTLIGLLLNSKNEYRGQPPHFPILDDFVIYLENLKKKGATMHPNYTQKDMQALEQEYKADFVGRYPDPLATFLDHYSVKLGYLDPDEMDQNPEPGQNPLQQVGARPEVRGQAVQARTGGRRKEARLCEDCEENAAEVFCVDCPGGIALCRPCSAVLHAGATRRRHTLQDIAQAPKTTKPYVPRAFLAPFAIVVAMFSAMRDGKLSLTENEIKESAQSLTDTDLQDKQHGKYVGGFDCMENVLMMKGFVQKEAARVPTYALTESGQILGEKLYTFYMAFYNFSQRYQLPKVANGFRSSVLGNRQLCLLIDENERDKERLLRFAAKKQISAQVLPFVVERKSWEDLGNSTQTNRFRRQINNMLGSGLKNCFYLMEGTLVATKFNPTHQRQHQLKALIEKLTSEHGFYVNYTTSWMKSAQWLLWFTSLIMEGIQKGLYRDDEISCSEYMSKVARQQGAAVNMAAFTQAHKHTHQWSGQLFIDYIFRDSLKERPLLSAVREDLRTNDGHKHMLIIEDLQDYNKKRQSTLNKCCDAACAKPGQAREIVEDKLGGFVHNLVHYDIPSYWQLSIQILLGVYVVRTESEQDRDRVKQRFMAGPQDPPPAPGIASKLGPRLRNQAPKTPKEPKQQRKRPAQTVTTNNKNKTPPKQPKKAVPTSTIVSASENQTLISPLDQFRRKAQIHTIDSITNPSDDRDHVTQSDSLIGQNKLNEYDSLQANTHTSNLLMQPFSGRGFSLGRSSEENSTPIENVRVRDRFNTVFGSGLLGGMRDSGTEYGIPHRLQDVDESDNELDNDNNTVALDPADFIDSQNEDEILKEVLNKSIANGAGQSNEEHMVQLALALSKQENNNSAVGANSDDELLKEAIERSKLEARNNNSEDKLLKEAIERSKIETSPMRMKSEIMKNKNSNDSHRYEQLIQDNMSQRSKLEAGRQRQTCVVMNDSKSDDHAGIKGDIENIDLNNEETMLKYAMEMSLKEHVKEEKIENETTDILQTEEEQIQMALEMSLSETPIKSSSECNKVLSAYETHRHLEPYCNQPTKYENSTHEKSPMLVKKSSDTPIKTSICRYIHSELEPEKNTRKAVKRKLVTNEFDSSFNNAIEDIRKDIHTEDGELKRPVELNKGPMEVLESSSNIDEQLKMAIEKSTIEHTPRKKSRKSHEEDLRLAIEISKAEQCVKREMDSADKFDADKSRVIVNKNETRESDIGCYSRSCDESGYEIPEMPYCNQSEISDMKVEGLCIKTSDNVENSMIDDKDDLEEQDDLSIEEDLVPPTPEKLSHSQMSGSSTRKKINGISSAKNDQIDSVKIQNQSAYSDSQDSTEDQNKCSISTPNKTESDLYRLTYKAREVNSKEANTAKGKNSGLGVFRKILADSSDESDYDSECGSDENIFDDEKEKDLHENKTNIKDDLEEEMSEDKTSAGNDCEKDLHSNEICVDEINAGQTVVKEYGKVSSPCLRPCSESEPMSAEEEIVYKQTHNSFSEKSQTSQKKNFESDIGTEGVETLAQDVEGFDDLDDDRDIDYQPSTQELKEVEEDEVDEKSDESEDEFDDEDNLPVILPPRSKRYRELKAKYDRLLKGSKDEGNSNNKNDKTDGEKEEASYEKDRDLARQLQEEIDREFRRGANVVFDNEDELIAKRLQDFYDKKRDGASETAANVEHFDQGIRTETALTDEEYARKLQAELEQENVARKLQDELEQERLARKLQAELEQENIARTLQDNSEQDSVTRALQAELEQDGLVEIPSSIDATVINLTDNVRSKGSARQTFDDEVIDLVEDGNEESMKDLQRRKMEKFERMKQNCESDEQLARQMQNIDQKVIRSPYKAASQELSSQASFRKHVSQQKASKEEQMKQLQQYRRERMDKYNRDMGIETTVAMETPDLATGSETIDLTDMINEPYTQTSQHINIGDRRSPDRHMQGHTQYQPFNHNITQSQTSTGSHLTQIDLSQPSTSGHVTQTSQSQRSNITCGNCGEKGHNRKFVQCPRYHSAEETARREEMAREDKKKKEERAVQEMILKQINAEKDEKKKQEIKNMQQIVLSAETEFQTTMNRLRNILHEVEHLSEPEQALQTGGKKKSRKKKK